MSRRPVSRRQFLGHSAAAAAVLAVPATPGVDAQTAVRPPANPDQDLVLTNGRIHTMDARNTIARTVSFRNGRLATVGDAVPPRRAGDRVIDLRGRTVVPGLIEPHVHIVSLANRPGYHTILENTR